ncbi:unnamed protein product [Arabis nemorensis]|uniref:methionine--tRNA ligase n=1 Tax=Arabis nemorensis TaxID=586526 RepID=A0A565AN86_9BRAS|nr:unnamed protein product [Arabis nemorensis]
MEEDNQSSPKLPIHGKRNILITSALPKVNNVPHLGSIIGCVLSADVYARFCRLRGYNAIYVCGTDEYGTATETKALEQNCIPREIYLYCDTCERFLPDRLIEGSCPFEGCDNDSARGDECEECENDLINPTYLRDPWCKVCQTIPRARNADELVIEFSDLKDKFEKYFNESVTGSWSQNTIQTTNTWLEQGLVNRSITRDLRWGVPVPHENYEDKWWKNPENVELCQFIGKDNVPFHTVLFPSMQLGTGENWTMMKTISVTEYLNYEDGYFSKSKGVGVFGNVVRDTNIPVEVWRYYLLINRPEVSATSFEWKDLQRNLNNKLLTNLGNFVNRVQCFIAKPESQGYGFVIPDAPGADSHLPTMSLCKKVGKLVKEYVEAMGKETQYWRLYKEDKPCCAVVIRSAVGLTHLLAQLLEPFMPSFSREVFKQLNLPPPHFSFSHERGEVLQACRPWEILPPSHRIGTPQPLFKELINEEVKLYKEKFAGSQTE